jgi:hypothetical protein
MGSTFLGYNPIPLSVSKQMGSSRSQSGIVGSVKVLGVTLDVKLAIDEHIA